MNTIEMEILSDANACPCGGVPRFRIAHNHGDVSHLHCSNHRCRRIVPALHCTVAETVELWNKEIAQETCVHSWFRQLDDTWRCNHCRKQAFTEKLAKIEPIAATLMPAPKGRWVI